MSTSTPPLEYPASSESEHPAIPVSEHSAFSVPAWEGLLPPHVRVVEVGPRDGLQNIDPWLPTEEKIALVNGLVGLGFERVEVTAFVHPRAIPQLQDAETVLRAAERGKAQLMVLVPNARGAERALACGPDMLNFVLSASETHNLANVNRTIERSLVDLAGALALADAAGIPLRLTIATAFGCPYEGYVNPNQVLALAERAAGMGVAEVCLGDTTGMANPRGVVHLFTDLQVRLPGMELAVHLHNTRGSGAANLLAALQAGITRFDAAVGGLGGCPYAPGATGNVCTEDMVNLVHDMGVPTGVDLDALISLARRMEGVFAALGVSLPGQVIRAGTTRDLTALPGHG